MLIFNKKKSDGMLVPVLLGFVILIFVFFISAGIFTNVFGKEGAEASNLIGSTGDYDTDGIANYFDKCACVAGIKEYDGCTKELYEDPKKLEAEQEKCRDDMKT